MISSIDVAWAAGLIEGEGSISNAGSPHVTAAQVQREPLDRLVRIFGGNLTLRTTKGFSGKPIWVWKLGSYRSVEVMMTLYVLMSPKRQDEIRAALDRWKRARLMKRPGTGECARGHKLEPPNIYLVRGRWWRCRACTNLNKRLHRAALRAAA